MTRRQWRRVGACVAVACGAGVWGCAAITSANDYQTVAVDQQPLRIGMPTALQGVSRELGIQMKRGVEAWFKHVNEKKGGIKGSKPLVLVPVNDDYEPAGATNAIRQLLDVQGDMLPNNCATTLVPPDCVVDRADTLGPNKVLSVLGQVGTPTMVVTAPVCIRNRVIYFGPFTGAHRFLRDSSTTSDVIFNYRASYYEEAAAFVDYFFRTLSPPVTDFKRIIGFTQKDTFGDAGYNGFFVGYQTKLGTIGASDVKRIDYIRNDIASVDQSIAESKAYIQPIIDQVKATTNEPFSFGIFMIPSYAPAAKYIKDLRNWINEDSDRTRLFKPVFMNVSFVGADALVNELKTLGTYVEKDSGQTKYYGDGVWVTQVVPYYTASLPGVVQYRNDLQTFDAQTPTWGSLEGYLSARLFTEGLDRTTAYDTDSMVKAYETIKDFDLGVGPQMNFDKALPEGHQASHTVWLSRIKFDAANPTGTFEVPWLWKGPVAATNQIVAP